MKPPRLSHLVVAILSSGLAGVAHAHFALEAPPAYSEQDALGLPEKSAPCGQADPGTPVVPTNVVTTFHAGDTITVTIDELIFHPGHYRVALAPDQTSLPADPVVTASDTACGSAAIETSSTPGVIVDNQLPHTAAFTSPQSFQITLPTTTCTNCTLQVVEFMSDHALNVPGGCFYHHCAQVNLVAPGTAIPDAGTGGSGTMNDGGTSSGAHTSGGCSVGTAGSVAVLVIVLGALVVPRRRRVPPPTHVLSSTSYLPNSRACPAAIRRG